VSARERGFTLLELAAVVSIITILASIAVPTYAAQRRQAKDGVLHIALTSLELGVETYAKAHEDGLYPAEATRESLAGYLDRWPQDPYSRGPLSVGTAVGQYEYAVSEDRQTFTVTVHTSAGDFSLPSGYPMPSPAVSP